MNIEKIEKIETALKDILNELNRNDVFTEDKFYEQWKYVEDLQDIKSKLTGKEKNDGFEMLKSTILKVTKNNYRIAGLISYILLKYIKDKGFDELLEKIKNNEIVIEKDEIKLLENVKFAMKYKEHDVEHFDSIISLINNNITKDKNQLTGFKTFFTDIQQTELYKALKGNYIDCTEVDFKAMFTGSPKPLKWIDKGGTRHEPNKQTIFEFFYLLKEYKYLKDPETDLNTIGADKNNFNRKLEYLFPDIANFSQSSGTGKSAKNTPRKKELETIIKSL